MAKQEKLTDSFVRSAEPPVGERNQVIHYDSELKGFGLRVTRFGARAFILNYRARGVERRYTIGSYPDWKVATAREEAKRLKRLVDQGRDPMGDRHEERAAPTVNDLVDRYLSEHAPRKRERSRRDDQSMIEQWIKPELGNRKVADVRYEDIEGLHRKVTAGGTPTRANRVAALLSKMFSLAVRWELRADNPARGIERNGEERRNRYLACAELARLTDALAAHPNKGAANALRLLLLTGARRGEVLASRWDQFDLEEGVLDETRRLHEAEQAAPGAAVGAGAAVARRDKGSCRSGRRRFSIRPVAVRFSRSDSRRPHARIEGPLAHDLQGRGTRWRPRARFEAFLRLDPGERWIVAPGDRRFARPHSAGNDGALRAFVR